MIKLKDIINELWQPGSLTSGDEDLQDYPSESSSITHKDWFVSTGINDWHNKNAGCSVYINETGKKPIRMWIEINTRNIKSPKDTHSSHHDRVRKTISKVAKAWASEARRLYREPKRIAENGNKTMRTWVECFTQAIKSERVAAHVTASGSNEAVLDPVNFSHHSS
jgi:hypothetical protein